ncbi:cysteine desulfuration protein SufE [Blochmannia endosymbiont of Camponotus (Colobopsis) obliquus]|uniref:cysteine desulfuration protein SufE n=1 Tax=Blochmannia endosymbiont of Camponotus (Colobopsis) obliquus TaxID=1505597 RepID=UPI00061A78AF|nr:cysteine desulfuration protein SufE [Blochmannia endosymbiont of Camponotus (Colobopsis) obliquus]AKC60526.1 cysteine desulfuration protein sufE [Blochmannia endosymbiont of Camponotus (Colobopsis) obliquus]
MNLLDKNTLLKNFLRCENWEEKYLYIITLGNNLSPAPNNIHSSKFLVPGCQSKTWIMVLTDNHTNVQLYGDSNSSIVKGIIAIIFIIYQGLTLKEIIKLDVSPFIKKLNLHQNLTFTRTQGLGDIIRTLRKQAICNMTKYH